ncbi:MAG: type IV pilus secretin PilQ family protein, partial [Comamonas sp.]
GPGFKGERLSLNFQNIEVRSLLQVIADFTNFNIVTSDTVGGSLTLRLKDVPWDQALNIIMEAKGLGMKKSGNVLWIAPKDEIDERTKRDYEAARNIEQLEPLRTQGFQINYAKAEELKKQIADNSGSGEASTRFLSGRGSAIAEPRTNQLFVTDTPSKLEEITNLLKKLDVPVRQVLIEARIVEARDTFGRSLGVKFGGGYERAGRGSVGSGYDKFGTSNSAPFVNLPAGLSTGGSAGTLALSIFNSGLTRFLSLELSAMEAEGVGKVISSPRLLTADQTQAVIEQGTEYPYTQTAPNGATTVAFKKAVLKLEVKPQITPEGNIILDLDLNKDSRGETTLQGVAIDTKHIKTQVLVENGGTVVIGGIFEMEETNQVNKVPVLGDIPVMGNLFKSRTRESTKREMLVFITPRMVTDAIARN